MGVVEGVVFHGVTYGRVHFDSWSLRRSRAKFLLGPRPGPSDRPPAHGPGPVALAPRPSARPWPRARGPGPRPSVRGPGPWAQAQGAGFNNAPITDDVLNA